MFSSTHRRLATGLLVCLLGLLISQTAAFRSPQETMLTDAYLRGIMNHLDDKMMIDAPEGYIDYPLPSYEDMMGRDGTSDQEGDMMMMKEYEDNLSESMLRERAGLGLTLRDQEYLKHSSLFSGNKDDNQSINGNSDESKPTAAPSSNKNDANVLPAYCNPPNPCPIGYTAEDGCLETFENTAAFSREYQAAQDCMCDTEHMFDCPASASNKNGAKNRAAANMVDTVIRKLITDLEGEHKSVSKKYFADKHHYDELMSLKERAHEAVELAGKPQPISDNPYLQGDKLPIAAKKGIRVA